MILPVTPSSRAESNRLPAGWVRGAWLVIIGILWEKWLSLCAMSSEMHWNSQGLLVTLSFCRPICKARFAVTYD